MPADDVLLTGLAAMIVGFLAVLFGLIWLAKRLGHPRTAMAVGALGALYFVFTAIDTLMFCNGGPVILSFGAEQPVGGPALRCGGAGGVMTYAYAVLAAPFAALLLVVATLRDWYQWKDSQRA